MSEFEEGFDDVEKLKGHAPTAVALVRLRRALAEEEAAPTPPDVDPALHEALKDGLREQIADLEEEGG